MISDNRRRCCTRNVLPPTNCTVHSQKRGASTTATQLTAHLTRPHTYTRGRDQETTVQQPSCRRVWEHHTQRPSQHTQPSLNLPGGREKHKQTTTSTHTRARLKNPNVWCCTLPPACPPHMLAQQTVHHTRTYTSSAPAPHHTASQSKLRVTPLHTLFPPRRVQTAGNTLCTAPCCVGKSSTQPGGCTDTLTTTQHGVRLTQHSCLAARPLSASNRGRDHW